MAISTLSVAALNHRLHPQLPKPHTPVAFFAKSAAFSLSSLASSSSLSNRDSGEGAASSSTASLGSVPVCRRRLFEVGIGLLASFLVDLDAKATRIEYYATVGEPLCDMSFAKSGLGYCDVAVGTGVQPPRGELINIHYTARFADGTVFDSSYKRGRPLTLRIGVGKVLPGLDQGILGGGGVPPMLIGGKRKLLIPPKLGYGPEPVGCFSVEMPPKVSSPYLFQLMRDANQAKADWPVYQTLFMIMTHSQEALQRIFGDADSLEAV